ncbi:MAG: phosphate--acyl-ACP acyltransferase, partial [Clostridia bacterium]|nr:phosphate--acyl-ACP acyltransferase [Clostridia bacterium]
CDGFVGNVVLKTVEGMGHVIGDMVRGLFTKNIKTKIGALFVMSGVKDFKKAMDYREYGGAPLLGCKSPVIKGHGSSDAFAVFNAIRQAKQFVATDVISGISEKLKSMEDCTDV